MLIFVSAAFGCRGCARGRSVITLSPCLIAGRRLSPKKTRRGRLRFSVSAAAAAVVAAVVAAAVVAAVSAAVSTAVAAGIAAIEAEENDEDKNDYPPVAVAKAVHIIDSFM